jgi:hypothetical protein
MRKLILLFLLLASAVWAQNPVVRLSYVTPWPSGVSATGGATSSAVRIPNLTGNGTLAITGSGITGSPSGCSISMAYQQSTGGPTSSAYNTQGFTPANSYQSFVVASGSFNSGSAQGDTLVFTYFCSVYPGAGTITVSFEPITLVQVTNAITIGSGSNVGQSGNWTTRGVGNAGATLDAAPGSSSTNALSVQGVSGMTPVSVSAASLPLPSGAATSAKQPAPGTAGSASADVLTVQGVSGMTPVSVDGSAVTQPSAMSYATLFNAASATGTHTSSAIRIPNFAGAGVLSMTGSGITGSPSGCQIALSYQQSPGGTPSGPTSSAFATASMTPSNAYQSAYITPSAVNLASGDTIVAVYSCSVYPSAGAITVTYDPIAPATIIGQPTITAALAAGSNNVGKINIVGNAGSTLDAAPGGFSTNALTVQGVLGMTPLSVKLFGNSGSAVDAAPGSAAPANAVQMAGTDGSNSQVPYMDPCGFKAWTYYSINVSADTQIVAAVTGKNVYVCQLFVAPTAAAANTNIVEGTGTTCGTGTTGMMGGSTAALGAQVAANGGFVLPASGRAWMMTSATGHAMCIRASAQVTGVLAYVQQ